MGLGRGTLARIDRRLFAEFDDSGGVQLVKVPVSDAVWSTWKRYCDAVDDRLSPHSPIAHARPSTSTPATVDEIRSGSAYRLTYALAGRGRSSAWIDVVAWC